MKKLKKIIIGIVLSLYIFALNGVYAFKISELTGTEINAGTNLPIMGQKLITIFSTVGSLVSVIVLIILGIKYMMGSVEEKASYKKSLMPYVIGAGIVFAASAIASIVYNLAINI